MRVVQRVEKPPDVHLHDPAPQPIHRLLPQGRQCLVRRAARPEAVRTGHEVLLIDGFQDHDHRPLEDLILERWNPDGPGLVPGPLYLYDPDNRQTTTIDPLNNRTTVAYDKVGNVTALTDANNH